MKPPPEHPSDDALTQRYLQESRRQGGAPSDEARARILAHAQNLADEPLTAIAAAAPVANAPRRRWGWTVAGGALAAAIGALMLWPPVRELSPASAPVPAAAPMAASAPSISAQSLSPLGASASRAPLVLSHDSARAQSVPPVPAPAPSAMSSGAQDISSAPDGSAGAAAMSQMTRRALEAPGPPPMAVATHRDELSRAIASGDTAALARLLPDARALERPDAFGHTPLMQATLAGNAHVVRWLLARGADPAVLDAQGRSALQLAQQQHRDEIAELLRAAAR